MNKVFRQQIGRNMEVYVNDILIKYLRAADLCADVEETYQTLRAYDIKLNPSKCLFGAKGEKFLGYIVTEWGIEANSSKFGDFVWKKVKPDGDVTKMEAPWAGPFKIVEKHRSGTYYLEDEDGRRLERPWSPTTSNRTELGERCADVTNAM
ncbi:uncharacterized protein LOC122011112 [Zingiber officinale]|uniref:uncharacterized protein LOC122011112 n=1 Tax=Zingiber officinale TaxID=94328 RepID=UPI001C4B2DE8|nr:uncharacterized protein LOC122011112 [Zingiber officinale]